MGGGESCGADRVKEYHHLPTDSLPRTDNIMQWLSQIDQLVVMDSSQALHPNPPAHSPIAVDWERIEQRNRAQEIDTIEVK